MGSRVHEQRVAVGLGARNGAGAHRLTRAWTVLNHDGLSKLCRELLEHEPRRNVDHASGRDRNDHLDRPGWPDFGVNRHGQEAEYECGQA